MTLCNNDNQTWFSDTLTSREWLKHSPFRLGFQHHPQGPADVNAWKNMFDPYIILLTSLFQVYNKYLELQYNLKSEDVKKRAALLSKDKTKHFGHLFDALNLRSNLEAQVLNQPTNSDRSSPGIPSLVSDMPSENSSPSSTTDTPTTAAQMGSQPSTPRGGTLTNNRLVFHLATPPRTNDRSPTPLLESFI